MEPHYRIMRANIPEVIVPAKTDSEKVERILWVICGLSGLTKEQLMARSRKRELMEYRQMAGYLMCMHTGLTLKAIGYHLGNRDHSTVIHARDTVSDLLETNAEFRNKFKTINEKLNLWKYGK